MNLSNLLSREDKETLELIAKDKNESPLHTVAWILHEVLRRYYPDEVIKINSDDDRMTSEILFPITAGERHFIMEFKPREMSSTDWMTLFIKVLNWAVTNSSGKVICIKRVRNETSLNLQNSKKIIDKLWDRLQKERKKRGSL